MENEGFRSEIGELKSSLDTVLTEKVEALNEFKSWKDTFAEVENENKWIEMQIWHYRGVYRKDKKTRKKFLHLEFKDPKDEDLYYSEYLNESKGDDE